MTLAEIMRPKRKEAAKAWDPRPGLFPVALEMFEAVANYADLCFDMGRGTGKTTTCGAILQWLALGTPNCAVLYISDTQVRAKGVEWRHLCELAEEVGGKVNLVDMTITYPNKSVLYCTGADSPKIFNRKGRGFKRIRAVMFDECQDWKTEVLFYAITKVFGPRRGDLKAEFGIDAVMILAGTGTMDAGYWFQACTDPALGYHVIKATMWDNPHIAEPDKLLRENCKRAGVEYVDLTEPIQDRPTSRPRWVDTPDAMTRREFFAEFNSGGPLQIFPVNQMVRVPRLALPTRDLNMVICADFGTVDYCAVGAWIFTKHDPFVYFVEIASKQGLSNTQMVEYVREWGRVWLAKYKLAAAPYFVGDGGGLGKGLVMDIKQAEGFWEVDAAEKSDKVPNLLFMRGDMRTGYARFVDDLAPRVDAFGTKHSFYDVMRLPKWKDGHVGVLIDGHMPDELDACYMGERKVKELHFYEPPVPPEDPEVTLEKRIRAMMASQRGDDVNPWA